MTKLKCENKMRLSTGYHAGTVQEYSKVRWSTYSALTWMNTRNTSTLSPILFTPVINRKPWEAQDSRLKTQTYLFDHYLHFLKLHIINNYINSLFIWSRRLPWEPPLWKRKYKYTNSESISYYFKYLEYSSLNVTFWHIMGEESLFIRDLKKLNWIIHEYITYKQVSIYLWSHCFTQYILKYT